MTNPLAPEWLKVPSDLNALDQKIWPSNVSRDKYGEMQVAGLAVTELSAQFGTPL